MKKQVLLTGNCSHKFCKKRSVMANKADISNFWIERCEAHIRTPITLDMQKIGVYGFYQEVKVVFDGKPSRPEKPATRLQLQKIKGITPVQVDYALKMGHSFKYVSAAISMY